MYWQKEIETMPRPELERLQLDRLRYIVDYADKNVAMYNRKFAEAKVSADKIKQLSDIQYFPVTTKDDLRDNYPFELFARPMKEIVRMHASSGTTGKPIVGGYTRADLNNWADQVARICAAVGVTDEDVVQISFGYGLFTGALGLHYGLEKIGAAVVPISSGNTQRQLMLMEDFGVTALVATPSYAMYLSELAHEAGIRERLKLRVGLFGGEGCTPEMRTKIEDNFAIMSTDNYGLTELNGPGVSGECHLRCGLHFAEDHFLPEIVDENMLQKARGEDGELLVTTLTKEGMPMIRYRTKDITRLNYDVCGCGRTHARMEKIKGRSDDMLIIKGVNVFPSQIESVIMSIPEIGAHYQLIIRRDARLMDNLEVKVELIDGSYLVEYKKLESLQNMVRERLRSVLQLDVKATLVEPKSLERFEGKARRIVDERFIKKS